MTCSRVIIIHKGRIEACDTPENLLGKIRQAGGVELQAKVGNDNGAEELKKIPGVRDVVTDIGEAGTGNQADVTRTNDRDIHTRCVRVEHF